jgi:predicted ester cyclase
MRITLTAAVLLAAACARSAPPSDAIELTRFATRYAAAWSSQDAASVAAFYADSGSININGSPPSVGRAAVAADAQGFMTAFPDMVVSLDSLVIVGEHPRFYWTVTGTGTGADSMPHAVRFSGYEEWTMSPDGKILHSEGHFDAADLARQLAPDTTTAGGAS